MYLKAKLHPVPPLLKYPGGKEKERKIILPALPERAGSYYDPFVGGGAVFFSVEADHYYINDRSEELMALYRYAAEDNKEFFDSLSAMDSSWQFLSQTALQYEAELLSLYDHQKGSPETGADAHYPWRLLLSFLADSLPDSLSFSRLSSGRYLEMPLFWEYAEKSFRNKIPRMIKLEETRGRLPEEDILANLEGCLKAAFYSLMRSLYNGAAARQDMGGERIALYFFLREYCYSSMFRYNAQGEFNVPYGGLSYNRKNLSAKREVLRSAAFREQMARTSFLCEDFADFTAQCSPGPEDFVFLDPPYDTEFASYDGWEFGKADHERLAAYVREECPAYIMLIIKDTDFIRELYPEGAMTASGRPLSVYCFDKKYFVSFKSRNDRRAKHLLITNYPVLQDGVLDL